MTLDPPDNHHVILKKAEYKRCKFALDDPAQAAIVNRYVKEAWVGVLFVDSLIEYHGGPLTLLFQRDKNDPKRMISGITFEHCIFDFSVSGEPPDDVKKLLLDLLLNSSGEINTPPDLTLKEGLPPDWYNVHP